MSDDGLDALRRELVAERGLDPDAARFLDGTTVDELERQADALAALAAAMPTREQAQRDPLADALARGPADKQRRQRALLDALHRPPPPAARDEHGRYVTRDGSFDGGARRGTAPREPESHDQWLARALATRSADVGRRL